MKITIQVNDKPVDIELTADQIAAVKKQSVNVTDRVKTFADVLVENNMSDKDFALLTKHYDAHDLAFAKVRLTVKALVGNWVPDWQDGNQKKWFPYFNMNDTSDKSGFGFSRTHCDRWSAHTTVGSRLVFPTSDLAAYAGKQFIELYREHLK